MDCEKMEMLRMRLGRVHHVAVGVPKIQKHCAVVFMGKF